MPSKDFCLPDVIYHADWSANPAKRWMALALRSSEGHCAAHHPTLVGDPTTLLYRLREIAGRDGIILAGFDFPIGLPLEYARKVGVEDFLDLLPNLGRGRWKDFFSMKELNLSIWPFSGPLMHLLKPGRIIIAETYPADVYTHLGISFSYHGPGRKSEKRVQVDRAANAERLIDWAQQTGVSLADELRLGMESGLGSASGREDLFDACIGLFGMLNVVLGRRPAGDPQDSEVRRVEGWILGQGNHPIPAFA